ncbi:hypothetical protein LTS18_001292, partial [Coniosporium uncinatum]
MADHETKDIERATSAPLSPTVSTTVDIVDIEASEHEKPLQYASITSPKDKGRPSLTLDHVSSHVSNHDMAVHPVNSYIEPDDSIYDRLTPRRKTTIVAILSLCGFLAPISSTSILAAVPEVARTYNTTGTIINLSNAMYLVFMGLSPMFWGPIGTVYGRRAACIPCALLFFVFSIGTALAPNLAAYYIFRVLTAFQGTGFLIVGASTIGDIYRPVERAT